MCRNTPCFFSPQTFRDWIAQYNILRLQFFAKKVVSAHQ
jgi:hypothetical protein